MTVQLPNDERALFRLALAIVALLTLIRIGVLIATPLQLYPDEAQYWSWAQVPDWGYFSKPPLVAWIIWLTTRLADAEWAIRLASPLLHGATGMLMFQIGSHAYGPRVGFWSALAYVTMPGVSYSSGLISSDVPLLFCWAAALYGFLRALDRDSWRWPLLCGAALGVGLLAKYAMLYFLLGAILAAAASMAARRRVFSLRGFLVLVLGLVILSPNVAWNAAHGWPTLAHTEANANWSNARYDLRNIIAFILSQFGVIGPLMMAGWIGGLLTLQRSQSTMGVILACFSMPVLLLIVIQSFISEANANWAAPAYVAAVPLAVATLLRWWSSRLLWLSLGLGTAAMVGLWAGELSPALADRAGFGNALKRQEGWRELAAAVAAESRTRSYDAIAVANRSVLAELLYYARPRSAPVRAWDRNTMPRDHFQMTIPLLPGTRHMLLVTSLDEGSAMLGSFDSHRLLRTVSIPLGRHHERVLALYDALFYRGPQFGR